MCPAVKVLYYLVFMQKAIKIPGNLPSVSHSIQRHSTIVLHTYCCVAVCMVECVQYITKPVCDTHIIMSSECVMQDGTLTVSDRLSGFVLRFYKVVYSLVTFLLHMSDPLTISLLWKHFCVYKRQFSRTTGAMEWTHLSMVLCKSV